MRGRRCDVVCACADGVRMRRPHRNAARACPERNKTLKHMLYITSETKKMSVVIRWGLVIGFSGLITIVNAKIVRKVLSKKLKPQFIKNP